MTVKNKDIDYREDDPLVVCNDSRRMFAKHVPEDIGVGYCKN